MPAPIRITSPRNGDILNRHDGTETAESLTVEVAGDAPRGAQVTVNGIHAHVAGDSAGGTFQCAVPITQRRNEITATAVHGGTESTDTITVLWDKGSQPRYRFSVDDNIQFLRELGSNPDDYPSLFDHWYLAFWRRMHEEFGAKIHINIYHQTVGGDFTLDRIPTKWHDEWEANADWLHLSFHALQDQPEQPYRNATYDEMARDYDAVVGHIKRFAGYSVVSNTTTVHWAAATKDACRALYDRGIRVLIGIFRREFEDRCPTGYYLPDDIKDHINTRDYYYDPDTELIFITEDATVNNLAVPGIEPWLDNQAASPHTSELIELLIHEQYFREELPFYQPDIQDKVIHSLRWVTARGYAPVFWGEGFLGNSTEL